MTNKMIAYINFLKIQATWSTLILKLRFTCPTLILITGFNVGSRELTWPTPIWLFSVPIRSMGLKRDLFPMHSFFLEFQNAIGTF